MIIKGRNREPCAQIIHISFLLNGLAFLQIHHYYYCYFSLFYPSENLLLHELTTHDISVGHNLTFSSELLL